VRVAGAGHQGRSERPVAVPGDDRGVGVAVGVPVGLQRGLDGLPAGGRQAAVEAEGERVPPGGQHPRDRGHPGGDRRPVVGAVLRHQVDAVPDGGEQAERRPHGAQRFADLDCGELGQQPAAQEPGGGLVPPRPGAAGPVGGDGVELGEGGPGQVGAGADAFRPVVGGHARGAGDPAHRPPHRVEGRLSRHVPFADLEHRARHGR